MKIITLALAFTAILSIGIAQKAALSPENTPKSLPKLPDSAKADPELAKLSFMAGRWVGINPNNTVNEEHWMAPKGNNMVGTFRQIRRDGKAGLIEVSLIFKDETGIKLKLRHLHGGLEVPKGREETDEFLLKEVQKNKVEFTGTGKSAMVTSVIYRLLDKNRMAQEVAFDSKSGEKGYSLLYFRSKN